MAKATRAEWAKRVERWKDSGLTAKEFAAELDIKPSSLAFWKWKLRTDAEHSEPGVELKRSRRQRVEVSAKFLQLVPTPTDAIASLELVLKSGVVLRVPEAFHEPTLRRLLDALGGR